MNSNRQRSVSVFVKRERGLFVARTHVTDAIDLESATLAARRCAAAHFGVNPDEIELLPDSANVLIALVKVPSKAIAWVLLSIALGIAAAIVGVVMIVGGRS